VRSFPRSSPARHHRSADPTAHRGRTLPVRSVAEPQIERMHDPHSPTKNTPGNHVPATSFEPKDSEMNVEVPVSCPVSRDFDPFSPAFLADPYPALAAMRAEGPVFAVPDLDLWAVTRAADIDAIFADPVTFSSTNNQDPLFPLAPSAIAEMGPDFPPPKTMLNCDPPDHGRIRRFNLRSFSARRTAMLEPKVRKSAATMVDALLSADRFDVVTGLTFPLPAYMIFTLIGFPDSDTELLKSWCGNRMAFSWGHPDETEQVEIARGCGSTGATARTSWPNGWPAHRMTSPVTSCASMSRTPRSSLPWRSPVSSMG